tara:strand:- start:15361 stop:16698 length:1338 start_codon:yes stop_codon:yes gene_type:complete
MTCRDLGQFSIPYNTKDILNSYSSAQKAAKRRDIALAMAARDIDRSGNNQLNRLLAYRKERAIAPEFQEAQIERLAGDNYREKEFQRKQEEAMDWQNNFLYNTALFSQGMLDKPSRWEQEDVGELQERVGGEYLLGSSFFKPGSEQGGTRDPSREPSSRGRSQSGQPPERPDFGGASAPSLQSQVSQAFGSLDPNVSSAFTSIQNPSLGPAGLSIGAINQMVFNFLPPQQLSEGQKQKISAPRMRPPTNQPLVEETGSLSRFDPSDFTGINKGQGILKFKGGRVVLKKPTSEDILKMGGTEEQISAMGLGSSGLPGLDEATLEAILRSGISASGEAPKGDPRSSIEPLVVASAPESVMSFDDKVLKMLELFDYPNEIQGQYGPELIPDDLRLDFGAWLVRNPKYPKRGYKAWEQFLTDARGLVQASTVQGGGGFEGGGSVRTYGN